MLAFGDLLLHWQKVSKTLGKSKAVARSRLPPPHESHIPTPPLRTWPSIVSFLPV